MKLVRQFFEVLSKPRSGIAIKGPDSITIHWIGAFPSQTVYEVAKWWYSGSSPTASAHFVVKDQDVLQVIPVNEVAWHCGGKGNYTSIGIEIIPVDKTGVFSDSTISTLKELLETLPKVPLVRHYDWTGKDCPRYYTPLSNISGGDERWKALKERLTQ